MNAYRRRSDERGFALVMTVLVVLIVGSLVAGSALIGSNHLLVNRFYDRQSELEMAADQGLEFARARLNAIPSLYPADGYKTLESGVTVTDGSGAVIPGVRRWLYAGPSGVTSGQYGVFGTIVAVVQDAGGGRVIRRQQIYQESFSKYAYFTEIEPSTISFGGGDQIFGPVHTNDDVKIYATGATFHGSVRTARKVTTPQYGTFRQGYEENVSPIAMPATAELSKLKAQATLGNTAFVGNSSGAEGRATTRIEFVAVDLNGDGDTNDANEGFIRVYQATGLTAALADWVTGIVPNTNMAGSHLCGDTHPDPTQANAPRFISAARHSSNRPPTWGGGSWGHDGKGALTQASRRCYLGGAPELTAAFSPANTFVPVTPTGASGTPYAAGASYPAGRWLTYPGVVSPLVSAARNTAGANYVGDAAYLFPITRELNPNFKGVIYVQGRVALSGRIRGRVTVAASDDIIFADDITYVTDPGAGTCVDIAGYFAGDDIIVADNPIHSPQQNESGGSYRTYDDTSDEFIHGTVLALGIFTVQNYDSGSTNAQPCGTASWGRGCLFLTGGIIQNTRGAVGTSAGHGNVKRYSYDACAATNPPPYFPTTGYFARGQYYQVDPAGFNVDDFFALITP